jgi:hypothetical protein
MVLNTSFNTLKTEPITETPRNAVRSFLSSMGTMDMLVMGEYVIKRNEANIRTLLGEEQKNGMMTPPSFRQSNIKLIPFLLASMTKMIHRDQSHLFKFQINQCTMKRTMAGLKYSMIWKDSCLEFVMSQWV